MVYHLKVVSVQNCSSLYIILDLLVLSSTGVNIRRHRSLPLAQKKVFFEHNRYQYFVRLVHTYEVVKQNIRIHHLITFYLLLLL